MAIVTDITPDLEAAFANAKLVALDIEGVNLGRSGKISLVQIATGERCFLLDLLEHDAFTPLVAWLRRLLESPRVLKIIHDCRRDSDALKHLLGISLQHVHDTSCWHYCIRRQQDASLNHVLEANGMRPNAVRDPNVYAQNHAFWATRPLTRRMIEWASGDVTCMFQLYALQVAEASDPAAREAALLSETFLNIGRLAKVESIAPARIGALIGHKGCNIRALQRRTNTLIYPKGSEVVVYYHDDAGLREVLRSANKC